MKIINDKSSARHTYVCVNYNHLGRIKAFIYYEKHTLSQHAKNACLWHFNFNNCIFPCSSILQNRPLLSQTL